MMTGIKNFFICSLLLLATTYSIANAGGFTSGKGKYDFTSEYEITYRDNSAGKSNGVLDQDIEINNEFGITQNQSIAFDFFYNSSYIYSDTPNGILRKDEHFKESFQVRYRATVARVGDFGFGFQTGLYFTDKQDGAYKMRWSLRGMFRHDNAQGFYKTARLELEYRRWFVAEKADQVRIDARLKFRMTEGIDFFIRSLTFFNFASASYLNENPKPDVNPYFFNGQDIKVSHSDLYFGPEFKLVNDQMVYAYGTFRIDGAGQARRNHRHGLLFGYSVGIDL